MPEEVKKEKVSDASDVSDKTLADEISDIDSLGSDEPLDTIDTKVDEDKDEKSVEGDKDGETNGDVSNGSNDETDKKTPKATTDSAASDADDPKGDEKKAEDKGAEAEVSQIDRLFAEVNRLSGLVGETTPTEEKKEEKKTEDSNISLTLHDFVAGVDMDDVSSDPAALNKILHAVASRVQQQTTEQILKNLPQEVMTQVNQQMGLKTIADSFYSDNPDLANVKQVVKACAQQLHVENPDWDMTKLFAASADRTRDTLGIPKRQVVVNSNDQQVPSADDAAFAKSSGGSKSNQKPRESALQRQIDEL